MSLVKWKSPERRIAEKSLLPNELLLDIIEYFVPHPRGFSESECQSALNRLAFVCRFFFVECTRRLFAKVTLAGSKNTTRRGHGEWIKQIIHNNPLAKSFQKYVQECSFNMWAPPTPSQTWVYSAQLKQRSQVVSGFSNLSTLHIEFTPLSQQFFMTILAKDSVHAVSIVNCNLNPPEIPWNIHALRPHWTSVRVILCYGAIVAYAEPLAKLCAGADLQQCIIDDRVIAYAVISKPVGFSRLQDVHVPTSSGVEQLLERTPSIIKLQLSNKKPHVTVPLSSSCLPRLQDLTCSPDESLLPQLISKPHLQNLKLTDSNLQGLEKGGHVLKNAVGLKSLGIPAALYHHHVDSIFQTFPKLDELRLSHVDSNEHRFDLQPPSIILACSITLVDPEVSLVAFDFQFRWLDIKGQHDVITDSVSKAFPHTKTIQISNRFEWCLQESMWKVQVIDRHIVKSDILHCIKKAQLQGIEDFDGVLVGLFGDEELKENPALRSVLGMD